MLHYDRIHLGEGTDPVKNSINKECLICWWWYYNHRFQFQNFVCDGYYDLTMLCLNISDIAKIAIKRVDYGCIIHDISKSEEI